jgi:hypothetical protein
MVSSSDLNLAAYGLLLVWMVFWSVRSIRTWTGGLSSIKGLLFLGCAWVGIISAGLTYFAK